MYNLLLKRGQMIAFGLGFVFVAIFLISIFGGLEQFNLLPKEDKGTTSIFNFGLGISIVLTLLCAAAAVLFGLFQAISNPKGAMFGIIGLAVLVGLWFIFYSMATPETSGPIYEVMMKEGVSGGQSKFIEGGLKTTLIVAGIALIAFVGSEIMNLFK